MISGLVPGLAIGWLAGVAPALLAQDAARAPQDPQRARLLRAIVIEEEERDLGRAVEAYRAVAQATGDGELRADAELRLAMALCAMGKRDEARPLLEALVKCGGARAQQAQDVLASADDQDRWLQTRTHAAMELASSDPARASQELALLGRGAMPHMVRRVHADEPIRHDLARVTFLTLAKWGGADAAQALRGLVQHKDVVVRRICAELLIEKGVDLAADVVPTLALLLGDASADVRAAALRAPFFAWEQVRPLLTDADATVRAAALVASTRPEYAGQRAEVLAAMRRELASPQPNVGLWQSAPRMGFTRTAEERAFSVELLRHPLAEQASSWAASRDIKFGRNELARELAEVAEVLAARSSRLLFVVQGLADQARKSWDHDVLPQVLRLVRAGGLERCGEWLATNMRHEDAAAVLACFASAETDADSRQRVYRGLPSSLPASSHADLLELFERFGEVEVLGLLVRTGADEAMRWLSTHVSDHQRFHAVCAELAKLQTPSAAAQALMLSLLDAMPQGGRAYIAHEVHGAREGLFRAVASLGREDAIPRLAAAYRLGMTLSAYVHPIAENSKECLLDRLDHEHVARVFDACLETGAPRAAADCSGLVSFSMSVPIYRAMARRALQLPDAFKLVDKLLSYPVDRESAGTLAFAALDHTDEKIIDKAVGYFLRNPTPDAVARIAQLARTGRSTAIRALGKCGDRSHAELLRSLMRDARADIRSAAAWSLHDLLGADAVEDLVALGGDSVSGVRQTLVDAAHQALDRRYAPALLRLLRDTDNQVREAAQKALEAIDFYHTQTARWQRLLSDTGLDAPSAAEALVKQARTGNDKAVRLAAIGSLGVLKVPETLPFLIQLMQETDPEVAAAARAAIARIQEK